MPENTRPVLIRRKPFAVRALNVALFALGLAFVAAAGLVAGLASDGGQESYIASWGDVLVKVLVVLVVLIAGFGVALKVAIRRSKRPVLVTLDADDDLAATVAAVIRGEPAVAARDTDLAAHERLLAGPQPTPRSHRVSRVPNPRSAA